MFTNTKIALAAAVILGAVSAALANDIGTNPSEAALGLLRFSAPETTGPAVVDAEGELHSRGSQRSGVRHPGGVAQSRSGSFGLGLSRSRAISLEKIGSVSRP